MPAFGIVLIAFGVFWVAWIHFAVAWPSAEPFVVIAVGAASVVASFFRRPL